MPVAEKEKYITEDESKYPFGYSSMGAEVLSAGKEAETSATGKPIAPPDLKEMFSLGPSNPLCGFPEREFPTEPSNFESASVKYYDALGIVQVKCSHYSVE